MLCELWIVLMIWPQWLKLLVWNDKQCEEQWKKLSEISQLDFEEVQHKSLIIFESLWMLKKQIKNMLILLERPWKNWLMQKKNRLLWMRLFLKERKNLKKLEKFNWRCKKKWIVWMQHGKIQRTWFEMLWFLLLIDCFKRLLLSLKELQTGLKRIQSLLHEYLWQSQQLLDWLLLWADWLLHFLQFEQQSQCFLDLFDGLFEQLHLLQLHGVKIGDEFKRRLKLQLIKSKKLFDRGLINFKHDGKSIEMLSWKEFERCFDLLLIW